MTAQLLDQIYHGKWFNILVTERHKFNKLVYSASESELRQAFMNEPKTLKWIIQIFHLNCSKDFIREVKK